MVDALRPKFHGQVAFVLADLHTPEGQAFATKHGVPNTTLVFFDATGKRLEILHGRREEAALQEEIRAIFGFRS